jgi:hypothetical protein
VRFEAAERRDDASAAFVGRTVDLSSAMLNHIGAPMMIASRGTNQMRKPSLVRPAPVLSKPLLSEFSISCGASAIPYSLALNRWSEASCVATGSNTRRLRQSTVRPLDGGAAS